MHEAQLVTLPWQTLFEINAIDKGIRVIIGIKNHVQLRDSLGDDMPPGEKRAKLLTLLHGLHTLLLQFSLFSEPYTSLNYIENINLSWKHHKLCRRHPLPVLVMKT